MSSILPANLLPYIFTTFVIAVIVGLFSRRLLWGFVVPLLSAVFLYGLAAGTMVGFAYAVFLVMTPPFVLASGFGAWLGISLSKKRQGRQENENAP